MHFNFFLLDEKTYVRNLCVLDCVRSIIRQLQIYKQAFIRLCTYTLYINLIILFFCTLITVCRKKRILKKYGK